MQDKISIHFKRIQRDLNQQPFGHQSNPSEQDRQENLKKNFDMILRL